MTGEIRLTRMELYELVWSTPMRTLAQRFGLSDVGLAKVCERHGIPRPPVGHWAKKQYGKDSPQPPLPSCQDSQLRVISFGPTQHEGSAASVTPAVVKPPEPEFDADIAKVLEAAKCLPPIEVPAQLRNVHALVAATQICLKEARPGNHNLVRPYRVGMVEPLSLNVGQSSLRRALLYLNTLIKTIERIGGKVTVSVDRFNNRSTQVTVAGDNVTEIRLRERYKQIPREKNPKDYFSARVEYVPTGILTLDSGPSYSERVFCQDDKRGAIETKVNEVIIEWIKRAGRGRISRREAELARLRKIEEDRIERERQLELQKQRDTEEKIRRAEQERLDSLIASAQAWKNAQLVREYADAVKNMLLAKHQVIDSGSPADQWLKWARDQADHIDPLTILSKDEYAVEQSS